MQAANEGNRNEYAAEHQRDRDQRAANLIHSLVCGFLWRKSLREIALDVLNDDDRVVDDDADREHKTKER